MFRYSSSWCLFFFSSSNSRESFSSTDSMESVDLSSMNFDKEEAGPGWWMKWPGNWCILAGK